MNFETTRAIGIPTDFHLLRALQTRLRTEFQNWCSVLTLEELAENPRLMQVISEVERIIHPKRASNRDCMIVEYETAFDKLLRTVSKQERKCNPRLKQKTIKIRCTLALLKRIVKPGRLIRQF
jgi:hypothetical protein